MSLRNRCNIITLRPTLGEKFVKDEKKNTTHGSNSNTFKRVEKANLSCCMSNNKYESIYKPQGSACG